MIYLKEFQLLSREQEEDYFWGKRNVPHSIYASYYPFGVFRERELPPLTFEPITFLYGGNGSGKTTVLNVIAEKLGLKRGAVYNRSAFFGDYAALCRETLSAGALPAESRIITSDDVFDHLLDIRCLNGGIDRRRDELFERYFEYRREPYPLTSLTDYDNWKAHADAQRGKKANPNPFVRGRVVQNVRERSNGESALLFFTEKIGEGALYLLDEPENSLSAEYQLELKTFLEASARGCRCQFIISTHSPFLLSVQGARVYDLDADPPRARAWTDLANVRAYYDFFRAHAPAFERD